MLEKAFNSWLNGYKNIFRYSGRSTRSEFGFFFIIQNIFMLIIFMILTIIGDLVDFPILISLMGVLGIILNLLTTLAYNVRRFHDSNCTGWICIGYLICAPIIIFVALFLSPTVGENKYGADPRQA